MMKLRINPIVAVDLKNIKEFIADDDARFCGGVFLSGVLSLRGSKAVSRRKKVYLVS